MIRLTIAQAAQRVGRSERTISSWITKGLLVAHRAHPILDQRRRYVDLDQLLDVERAVRQARKATQFTAAPRR